MFVRMGQCLEIYPIKISTLPQTSLPQPRNPLKGTLNLSRLFLFFYILIRNRDVVCQNFLLSNHRIRSNIKKFFKELHAEVDIEVYILNQYDMRIL